MPRERTPAGVIPLPPSRTFARRPGGGRPPPRPPPARAAPRARRGRARRPHLRRHLAARPRRRPRRGSPTRRPAGSLAAAALQIASCLAFVVAFRGVFCHRLPWRLSYEVGMAAQGTNVLLPSGGAGGLALAAWALQAHRHADRAPRAPHRRLLRADELGQLLHRRHRGRLLALAIGRRRAAVDRRPGGRRRARDRRRARAAAPAHPAPARGPRSAASLRARCSAGIRDAVRLARAGHPLILAGAIGFMVFDLLALGAAFAAIGALPPIGVLAARLRRRPARRPDPAARRRRRRRRRPDRRARALRHAARRGRRRGARLPRLPARPARAARRARGRAPARRARARARRRRCSASRAASRVGLAAAPRVARRRRPRVA